MTTAERNTSFRSTTDRKTTPISRQLFEVMVAESLKYRLSHSVRYRFFPLFAKPSKPLALAKSLDLQCGNLNQQIELESFSSQNLLQTKSGCKVCYPLFSTCIRLLRPQRVSLTPLGWLIFLLRAAHSHLEAMLDERSFEQNRLIV